MAGVHLLDRKHYLYHYDIQYFAMTCLRDTELNLCQQYYAADIIAKIAGMDGRLCLALARQDLYFHPKQSYRNKSYRSTWCQSSWKHRCSTSCPSSKTSAVTWSGNTKR